MAAASPTPLSSYGVGGSRIARHNSSRTQLRYGSPRTIPVYSNNAVSATASLMRSIGPTDSSDDEIDAPAPKLNPLTQSILANDGGAQQHQQSNQPHLGRATTTAASGGSAHSQRTSPRLRISRNESPSNAPMQDTITPAPSLRIKRVPLRGLPMRPIRRTPQGDEERAAEAGPPVLPSSQDQENLAPLSLPESDVKPAVKSAPAGPTVRRDDMPLPLAPVSANTPRRPAPPPPIRRAVDIPPPPKMSVLETATAAAGASTTKTKRRRNHITVNGKQYSQLGKVGKGGSSDVFRVMAENCKMFALKRVKLEDADETAVRGYKGEIELLQKLEDVERVVRLFDYEIDEEKQVLNVLMEMGESDLSRLLRQKLDAESSTLDLSFTRFYWKEMLECVQSVHEYDIVHSDLKPANFLLVGGRLKLIDFGIANAIDIDNTVNVHRESHIGTPNYMSPESLQDANAGVRGPGGAGAHTAIGKLMKLGKPSDVWSLGCILYQMVYGRPPFAHISNQIHRVMVIVNPNVTVEFPPHGVGGVRVPPGLQATLRKCLKRDPACRPTIPQLLDERDPFLHPDAGDDLRIPVDLLGQIIMRVAERFRDTKRGVPTDEEIKQYPVSFYAKIRELMEER